MYITPIEPPPGEIIQKKAELFGKRVPYVFQNYDRLWSEWYEKFQVLGKQMESLKIPQELSQFVPEEQVIPSPEGTRRLMN